jgi:hypothetical protein
MTSKPTPWHELKMPKSVSKPSFRGLPWISDIRKTVLILLILLTSCAPKLSTHGHYNSKPNKSEVRQRNFVILWTGVGLIIIGAAIQDDLKHSPLPR